MRHTMKLLAVALVAALALPAGAVPQATLDPEANKQSTGTPGFESFGPIEHVKNVPGWNASDLEFASREVVKLSNGATGEPVCVEDEEQFDGCARDEDGEIIYETEVRDFAIAGGYGPRAKIIDITDPRDPVIAGESPCTASQGDIQVKDDLLFIAQDGGSASCPGQSPSSFNGTGVLDFSDPRNPTMLSRLQYNRGSHNHTVHPTKPFVYLSDSDVVSTTGNIPVWNISDPANPVLATQFQFGVHSPHDITFNADGSRAYVAAVTLTYILNTEDPANPEMVSVIANEGISISHQADPTPDGNYLLVSDELGGGAAGPVSPGGPIHVYDIRNEERPVKLGAIGNDCLPIGCTDTNGNAQAVHISTSHVFRINPDGYTLAAGWYNDGVQVIDYSFPEGANAYGAGATTGVGPRVIAQIKMPGANVWTAKMWQERHPGYVFATNYQGNRGVDVFYVAPMGPGFLGTASLKGGHPVTSVLGGVTENEFAVTGCQGRPRSQAVDSYVFDNIDPDLGSGAHRIHLEPASVGAEVSDFTIWFYDGSCSLMSLSPTFSGDPIPDGAAHIVVANFAGAAAKLFVRTTPDA